jgi:RHS repeat-associated protein
LKAQLSINDSGGTIQDNYVYKAFGETQFSSGTTSNAYRFVGRIGYYFDAALTGYYIRARHYDPVLGRFRSRDRSRRTGGDTNLYRYVHNNAPNATDPSGLEVRLYTYNLIFGLSHVTVVVYDPISKRGMQFDGGGTGSSRPGGNRPVPSRMALDFSKYEDPDDYTQEMGVGGVGIVVDTGKSSYTEELNTLNRVFARLEQVPYDPFGPNSNTYVHQLLSLAGYSPPRPSGAVGWDYHGAAGYGGA